MEPEQLKLFGKLTNVDPNDIQAFIDARPKMPTPAVPTGGKAPTAAPAAAPAAVPTGGKAPAAPKANATSNSSGSNQANSGSKPFFNDKSMKYALTGAGIGGAAGYAMGDDRRRRSISEDEETVDEDDEQLEESLRAYIKNNASLFIG